MLALALAQERVRQIRRIENPAWFRRPVSHTFHGRDIFAPVAARLARGESFARVGPLIEDWTRLPWPEPEKQGPVVRGAVVYVDGFGNAITNIPAEKPGGVPAS